MSLLRRIPGRTRPLVVVGLLGLLLTVVAMGLVRRSAERAATATQERQLAVLSGKVQSKLELTANRLQGVSTLYAELPVADRRPGRTSYALRRLMADPALQGVIALEQVGPGERPVFEHRIGGPILRAIPGDAPVISAPRSTYVAAFDGANRAGAPFQSFDVAQALGPSPVLKRVATGRPALTAPLRELRSGRPSLSIYVPVLDRTGHPNGLLLAGSYDAELLLRELSGTLTPVRGLRIADGATALDGSPVDRRGDARPTSSFEVLGRRWEVSIDRRSGTRAGVGLAALAGLLATALACWRTGALTRRQRALRGTIRDRERERDEASDQAQAAERQARRLAENSRDMLSVRDADGIMTYVSPASRELLGYEPEELVGRHLADVAYPEDREEVLEAVARELAPGSRSSQVYRMVRRGGAPIWVEVQSRTARDPDTGRLVSQIAVRDVNARVAQEQRLKAAEQRFRGAFDGAPIGMALLTRDSRVLRGNAAWAALTGSPDATEGPQMLDELLHPGDLGGLAQAHRELLAGRHGSDTRHVRLRSVTGEDAWCEVHSTALPGEDGQPEHLLLQVLDVSEQRRQEAQLRHLADHDALTGLLNRRSLERALEEHLARNRRLQPAGALLIVDLDHFKVVNDSLGHSAGDRLLTATARALSQRLRGSDVLARLGGDEFAVLLPTADQEQAVRVAEAVLARVRALEVVTPGGQSRPVSASIGIAMLEDPRLDAEDAVVRADLALYDAKDASRDTFQVYDQADDRARLESRITWADRLRAALEQDRLELHAQPIVELASGRVVQHELLVRMRSEGGELIPPGAFLPVAERFGMVTDIDCWVIGRALELLATGPDDLVLAVNLSGASLGSPRVLAAIRNGLVDRRVAPHRLVLEVTETMAVADLPAAQHFADELRAVGCGLALDDFGSGFGSFRYLKHLPFDVVKVDGEFVSHCATNPDDALLVAAAVQLAHGLGKLTVAEYVEDEATLEHVRGLGVDRVQGFHVGRPAPVAGLLAAPAHLV